MPIQSAYDPEVGGDRVQDWVTMSVQLNHTIVEARDAAASASWFAAVFGLGKPEQFGPFWQVTTANGVTLAFDDDSGRDITTQHYAFLVTEDEFDVIFGRVVERGSDHFADPGCRRRNEINHNDGGRGIS